MSTLRTTSENFALCRRQAGLSLAEASKALDVPTSVLEGYEKGEQEPDALVLRRMALAYGCTSDQLLGIAEVCRL